MVAGGAAFTVGVYHMPCVFWDQEVMAVHAALVVEALDEFAGAGAPRVLLGDFNIQPDSKVYRLLTTGVLAKDVQDKINRTMFPTWRPKIHGPLVSA